MKKYFPVWFVQVMCNKSVQCSPRASFIVATLTEVKMNRHDCFFLEAPNFPKE